jgi:predicted MFS family arabinose efflux permease
LWENRAKEPIIPLRLFKNDIFTVSVILSLLSGIVMFASILYIPVYQQTVRGYSPTKSGLLMLPLVLGLLGASIISGRLISKLGKYKFLPLFGTLVVAFGLWLLSHLTLTTSEWVLASWLLVLGIGMGSFLQVMTLATQNAVDRSQLGTATSTATFSRSLGASLGGAIFGSILINRLIFHLSQAGSGSAIHISSNSIQQATAIHKLPPAEANKILQAFVSSFHDLFLLAIPVALAAFLVALFLRETPLRTSQESALE